jgi:hypothetical protein
MVENRGSTAKPAAGISSCRLSEQESSASTREFLARIPGAAAVTLAATATPFGTSAEAATRGNGSARFQDSPGMPSGSYIAP